MNKESAEFMKEDECLVDPGGGGFRLSMMDPKDLKSLRRVLATCIIHLSSKDI